MVNRVSCFTRSKLLRAAVESLAHGKGGSWPAESSRRKKQKKGPWGLALNCSIQFAQITRIPRFPPDEFAVEGYLFFLEMIGPWRHPFTSRRPRNGPATRAGR